MMESNLAATHFFNKLSYSCPCRQTGLQITPMLPQISVLGHLALVVEFFRIYLFVLKQNSGLDTRSLYLGNFSNSILNIVTSDKKRY